MEREYLLTFTWWSNSQQQQITGVEWMETKEELLETIEEYKEELPCFSISDALYIQHAEIVVTNDDIK